MAERRFEKVLTANDTGKTGAHQGGVHIPKGQRDLIAFLPRLDLRKKNPDVWLTTEDRDGNEWSFRYVWYNNSLHDKGGTRDEYRLTHMTAYFRHVGARPGQVMTLSRRPGAGTYSIDVVSLGKGNAAQHEPSRIRLRGWRRVH